MGTDGEGEIMNYNVGITNKAYAYQKTEILEPQDIVKAAESENEPVTIEDMGLPNMETKSPLLHTSMQITATDHIEEESKQEDLEELKEFVSSLTMEERQKLRSMNVNLSSGNLAMIQGIVREMRSAAHREEQLDNFGEAVYEGSKTLAESLSEITERIQKASGISDEEKSYLVEHDTELTLQNIYMAKYSTTGNQEEMNAKTAHQKAKVSHSEAGKYTGADRERDQLKPQIQKIVERTGIPSLEEGFTQAEFLLKHELPITEETLTKAYEVDQLRQGNINVEAFLERAAIEGTVDQTDLVRETVEERIEALCSEIDSIAEDMIEQSVQFDRGITIQQILSQKQPSGEKEKQRASQDGTRGDSQAYEWKAVRAKRQLAEIRLSMMTKAGYQLVKQDVNISYKELEDVVLELRGIEAKLAKEQLQAEGVSVTKEQAELYVQTNAMMEALPGWHAVSIVQAKLAGEFTIEGITNAGMRMSMEMAQATYEAVGTEVRADLGDSITKAFRNVDQLLEELKLPVTSDNQRAVRILGYNQMEINEEQIYEVKHADWQVQTLIRELTPAMTLQLIRNRVNPLKMPIEELNRTLEEMKEVQEITDSDSFSEFLYRMERKDAITKEERTSYIGIYRLLDKIIKGKGRDIGAVIRNGQELSLQNLLTATRSARAAGLDIAMDQTVGELVEETQVETLRTREAISSERIDEQIKMAYEQGVAKDILRTVTPEELHHIPMDTIWDMTLEELKQSLGEASRSDENAQIDTEQREKFLSERFEEEFLELKEVFEAATVETQTVLESLQQPMTMMHVVAAVTMTKNAKGIMNLFAKVDTEALDSKELEEEWEQLADAMNSPEEMSEAYQKLGNRIQETLMGRDVITAKDLQALKQIHAGIDLLRAQTTTETYQIPVVLEEEVTVLHVTFRSGNQKRTGIQATMETTAYGTVTMKASIEHKEEKIDVSVAVTLSKEEYVVTREAIQNLEQQLVDKLPNTGKASLYQAAKQMVGFAKSLDAKVS